MLSIWSIVLLQSLLICATSAQTSTTAAVSATVAGSSVGVSSATAAAAASAAGSLGPGEYLVTEATYISSLTKAVLTTYTATSTTEAAMTQATDLPASLYCYAGYANATGPFCFPNNGTQQIKGKQYSVTWNSDYAANCSDVYLSLAYYQNSNGQQVTSKQSLNVIGFWNYTVESDWLNGQSSQYAQVQILFYGCKEGTVDPVAGPIVEFLSKAPTEVVKATSKDEILGLSIGLPLALIAFVGTALFIMWWNKSHRQIPVFGRKKGYTGRRQRNIKLQDLGGSSSGTTYRDDPTA